MVLYPFFWMFMNSVKGLSELLTNSLIFPKKLHLVNYLKAWRAGLSQYFFNSVFISIVSVSLTTLIGAFASYGLTQFNFKFKNQLLPIYLKSSSAKIKQQFL